MSSGGEVSGSNFFVGQGPTRPEKGRFTSKLSTRTNKGFAGLDFQFSILFQTSHGGVSWRPTQPAWQPAHPPTSGSQASNAPSHPASQPAHTLTHPRQIAPKQPVSPPTLLRSHFSPLPHPESQKSSRSECLPRVSILSKGILFGGGGVIASWGLGGAGVACKNELLRQDSGRELGVGGSGGGVQNCA